MVKKAKDKRFLFFPFFVYEVAVYFFGLFDVCVKQCCPTINRNFILLSCSNKAVSSLVFLFGFLKTWGGGKEIGDDLELWPSCFSSAGTAA